MQAELERFRLVIEKHFAKFGERLILFEHNITRPGVVQHMHLQLVPVSDLYAMGLREAFVKAGEAQNMPLTDLAACKPRQTLAQARAVRGGRCEEAHRRSTAAVRSAEGELALVWALRRVSRCALGPRV